MDPLDSLTETKRLFFRSGGPGLKLSVQSDGSLLLEGPVNAVLPSPIELGKWHMVTLVGSYLPATTTVFVDGEEIGNVPGSSYNYGYNLGSTFMKIGGIVGSIDEVSFYDGVLSPTEIRTIYEREAPRLLYHTITQGLVDPDVLPQMVQMPSSGGSASAELTLAQNVNWTASTANPWVNLTSPAQGAGSSTVSFDVAANPTVYQRQGEVSVAGKTVTVIQSGLNATVLHDDLVFDTDGGSGWIQVSPEGNGQWEAVSDVSWLTVAIGAAGTGDGSVFIVADPYNTASGSRTFGDGSWPEGLRHPAGLRAQYQPTGGPGQQQLGAEEFGGRSTDFSGLGGYRHPVMDHLQGLK